MTQRLALLYARAAQRELAYFRLARKADVASNRAAYISAMAFRNHWRDRAEKYRRLLPSHVQAAIQPHVEGM